MCCICSGRCRNTLDGLCLQQVLSILLSTTPRSLTLHVVLVKAAGATDGVPAPPDALAAEVSLPLNGLLLVAACHDVFCAHPWHRVNVNYNTQVNQYSPVYKKPLVAAQSICPPLYNPTATHRRPARRWGRSRCGRTRRRSPGCWAGCRRSRRCRSTPAGGNTAPRDRTSWGTGEQVKHNSYLFNEKNIYLIGKPKYYLCEKHR